MKIQRFIPLTAALLAMACSPKQDDAPSADAQKTAAAGDANKEAAKETPEKAAAKAADAPKADDAKTEAEKEAEKLAKIQKRLADLKAATEKESTRWTDEMKQAAKQLAEADAGDLGARIDAILASNHRRPGNADRDTSRHPKETLQFFGITPTQTVIEVGPGAGWYTEILAPMLAKSGKLIVNSGDPNGPETEGRIVYARRTRDFLASNADLYGKVDVVIPSKPGNFELGADASADTVLVIRGLHGVTRRGELADNLKEMLRVLKPGGTLGIVQHRGTEGADPVKSAEGGYVPQAWLIKQVEAAGFKLVEASEINANANDQHEHPEGVWTLPPTLTLGDKDRAKYEAIGESDRMTLKFQKPA